MLTGVNQGCAEGPGDWALGIDAGNTKTLALLSDSAGTVRGWGRAGPCNIYVSVEGALAALRQAVSQAFGQAGLLTDGSPLGALTLSAAGADWPEDFTLLQNVLEGAGWASRTRVVNDAVGALRAGSLAGVGVSVVCGTSTGTAARSASGEVWHSGYWQEPEGAEELGRLALRAVYRAALGVGPPTTLSQVLPPLYGCRDAAGLLHHLTARPGKSGETAEKLSPAHLARFLLDEAGEGDPVSRELVARHGAALGDYALAAARQVGLSGDYLLVTSGGVMRHPSPLLREALLARVRETHPEVRWQASEHEPVFGAVLLALEHSGVPVTPAIWNQLAHTSPPPEWFATLTT